ncbi:hypothetical protein [Ignicoccus hospitalis]|nr:hypothetical protein [Ignicoccus hospitalis]HIH90593.1 hypothetical protein [Desulfurococcaceae archaeon]
MDYKKSTRLLEELLGVTASVRPPKLFVYKDCEGLEVPLSAFPVALAVFMPAEKAWAALRALYGEDPRRAYEEYLRRPSKACWLSREVAKAIAYRLGGKRPKGLEREVEKRWPNVCGPVDAFSEALKLTTALNEVGISASFYKGDKEGEVRTPYAVIKVKRSDPVDERFLKELRELVQKDAELGKRVLSLIGARGSCVELAEAVKLSEELLGYGFLRTKLREKAEELAKEALARSKLP